MDSCGKLDEWWCEVNGVQITEGCLGVTREGRVIGPLKNSGFSAYPWCDGEETFTDKGEWMFGESKPWDIIATFPTEAEARAWAAEYRIVGNAIQTVRANKPSRLVAWLRSRAPHDKQQAFIAGILVGMAIVAALFILSGCGGNTTEPHPPTCWPVVVIDSVEYCGGEG